jgi:hypothetical protein
MTSATKSRRGLASGVRRPIATEPFVGDVSLLPTFEEVEGQSSRMDEKGRGRVDVPASPNFGLVVVYATATMQIAGFTGGSVHAKAGNR